MWEGRAGGGGLTWFCVNASNFGLLNFALPKILLLGGAWPEA